VFCSSSSSSSVHCHVFAIIKEPRLGRSATVCGGGGEGGGGGATSSSGDSRDKHAYTSDGHAVEVRFMTARKAAQYLLRFEGSRSIKVICSVVLGIIIGIYCCDL